MLHILSYRRRLWELQRDKNKARKYYGEKIALAEKEEKSQEEIDNQISSLISEQMFHIDELDDSIVQIQTQFLTEQAEKYLIPTPEFKTDDGTWEESRVSGRWRWSQKTISSVKRAIREEQKYRREHWQGWLALLIGLVGALIGVFSFL